MPLTHKHQLCGRCRRLSPVTQIKSALQKSLTRLSSGSRIVQPVDDAGGLCGLDEDREFNRPTSGAGRTLRTPPPFSRFRTASFGFGGQNPQPDDRTQGIERRRDEERLGHRELQPRVQGPANANLRHGQLSSSTE